LARKDVAEIQKVTPPVRQFSTDTITLQFQKLSKQVRSLLDGTSFDDPDFKAIVFFEIKYLQNGAN